MKKAPVEPAALAQPTPSELALSGYWTALGTGALDPKKLAALRLPDRAGLVVDGSGVAAFDTVGARVLQNLVERLRGEGHDVQMRGWSARNRKFLELASQSPPALPPDVPEHGLLERTGRKTIEIGQNFFDLLSFVGEAAVALAAWLRHPARIRWRPIL